MKDRSKILIIAPQPFFAYRGTPLNVCALINALSTLPIEIHVVVYPIGLDIPLPENVKIIRSKNIFKIHDVPIGPSWRKILLDFSLILTSLRLLITNNYKVIHGVEEGGILAGVFSKIFSVPYVFDMDSIMTDQLATSKFVESKLILNAFGVIERYFLKSADVVLTVCDALSNAVRQISEQIKIVQIEDFADKNLIKSDPVIVNKIQTELGITEQKIILYTGNLERYQGIDLLLESFSEVVKKYGDSVRLVLVGGTESRVRHYQQLSVELKIAKNINFIGEKPSSEIGSYLSLASLVVSPRNEGVNTPLKIYSYLASGRLIVATDIFSHTQVLTDQNSNLGLPNKEAFSKALLDGLDNSDNAQATRNLKIKAALKLAEEKYSEESFREKILKLYSRFLN